jgi:hypothetical protein
MSKLSKRHFWEWFKRHQQEYLVLDKKPKKEMEYWLRELNAHLRAYYKFFGFSLLCPQQGIATLTITVKGKAMHFKRAEAFVATAPQIPGWSIQALEEPVPVGFLLEKQMEEAGIDLRECSFSLHGDDQETIMVYHPLCTDNNRRLFLQLAYSAVYNLLGERSFGLHIGFIGVDNLSYADPDLVHPLAALPMHIGLRASCMVVDGNGTLLDLH